MTYREISEMTNDAQRNFLKSLYQEALELVLRIAASYPVNDRRLKDRKFVGLLIDACLYDPRFRANGITAEDLEKDLFPDWMPVKNWRFQAEKRFLQKK